MDLGEWAPAGLRTGAETASGTGVRFLTADDENTRKQAEHRRNRTDKAWGVARDATADDSSIEHLQYLASEAGEREMRERHDEEGRTKEARNQHIVESWIASYNVMTHTIKYVLGKRGSPFGTPHAALGLGRTSSASANVDDEQVTFEARQRSETLFKQIGSSALARSRCVLRLSAFIAFLEEVIHSRMRGFDKSFEDMVRMNERLLELKREIDDLEDAQEGHMEDEEIRVMVAFKLWRDHVVRVAKERRQLELAAALELKLLDDMSEGEDEAQAPPAEQLLDGGDQASKAAEPSPPVLATTAPCADRPSTSPAQLLASPSPPKGSPSARGPSFQTAKTLGPAALGCDADDSPVGNRRFSEMRATVRTSYDAMAAARRRRAENEEKIKVEKAELKERRTLLRLRRLPAAQGGNHFKMADAKHTLRMYNLESPPRRSTRKQANEAPVAGQRQLTSPALKPMRKRMRAAAYTLGGADWEKLFRQNDKSGDGALDLGEFRSAVRRVLKMPPAQLTDADIKLVFRHIDADDSGEIRLEELLEFVNADDEEVPRRAAEDGPAPAAVVAADAAVTV